MPAKKTKSTKKAKKKTPKKEEKKKEKVEEVVDTPEEEKEEEVKEESSTDETELETDTPSKTLEGKTDEIKEEGIEKEEEEEKPDVAPTPVQPLVETPAAVEPEKSVLEPEDKGGVDIADEELSDIPEEKSSKKIFIVIILIAVLVAGVAGGIYYFRSKQSSPTPTTEDQVDEKAEDKQEEEPEVTSAPDQLEREEISLDILNGSGVAGLASSTANEFRELGYEIVEIGNAENIVENELYVNPEVEGLIEILMEDLEEKLDISSVSGELEDSTASARIILGE